MIACHFRFVNDKGPTGFYGIAFANTKRDLFWEIDRYGDPYSVEIKRACHGSFCCRAENVDCEDVDPSLSELEFEVPFNEKWKSPKWPDPACPSGEV